MPTTIVASQDAPRLTVSMMMKSPTLIPRRILQPMNQMFLTDAILRAGGGAPSGSVLYFETTPLFANDAPAVLDEFGAIPVTSGSLGNPKVVRTVRRALGLRVSKTMQDRNNVDLVNTQIDQVRNTMVRAWEDAFFSALLNNSSLQTFASTAPWDGGTTHIRQDINQAKYQIKNAASDLGAPQTGQNKLGFVADTLVISTLTEQNLLNSAEINSVYVGNVASEGVAYKGVLPQKISNLDVLVSWRIDVYLNKSALVCERKTLGFVSDERPLGATPMYGEGNGPNGGPTETWRTDTTRASAIGVDQPLAGVVITNVHA